MSRPASGERREIRILREPGAAGTKIAMLSCDNGAKVDSEAVDKDGKKTRVMICAQGGNQVEALERASKRVADNKDIPKTSHQGPEPDERRNRPAEDGQVTALAFSQGSCRRGPPLLVVGL
jgi:hypothetical protein